MSQRALLLGACIASVAAASSVGALQAGTFDGWCFQENACGGPYSISNDAFGTCEEFCRLTEPTKVNGMNGILYQVICEADHLDRPSRERMLLLRYEDHNGKVRALAVGKLGAEELVRCGR